MVSLEVGEATSQIYRLVILAAIEAFQTNSSIYQVCD